MTESQYKAGKKRVVRQRSKIDRLPTEVRDAILNLRADHTWQEIEDRSGLPFNREWRTKDGGFVDWDGLRTVARQLFPNRRIPHSCLHRWHNLRVLSLVG